ncbi:MAG: hypothetical protein WAU10_11905 [Caldilineaceae bacterium]
MLQRKTQTAAFWRDQFELTQEDLDYVHELVLDASSPLTTEQLALRVIGEYQRRETSRMESELSKGKIYQPDKLYEVGQTLVFPAMDFSVGDVTDIRPGENPEYGDFSVIAVKFAGSSKGREFACGLQTPHRLNQANGQGIVEEGALLTSQEIYDLYQDEITESLLYALEEGDRHEEFVQVGDYWLLADMLADVHIGHLNIAEALIEMQARPLSSQELLKEIDVDADISQPMQIISINHALSSDDRFDRVGNGSDHLWYLKRLEPKEALETPPLLRPHHPRYNRALLSVELLQIEWELDDEWGESGIGGDVPSIVPSTSFTLIYPHRRHGTLPLSSRTRSFFPAGSEGRSMVTIIDGRWGKRFTAWVVHSGRYVSGLKEWMEEHNLPVGAQITLERTQNPGEVVIDYRPRRMKREWSRFATAEGSALGITFEMNKIQITCEYDDYLIVSAEDTKELDVQSQRVEKAGISMDELVEQIVPELTKLSPQGTAHAKTVYSAVNMLWRCPPGPVFYALISNRRFRDSGGGFFALEV